MEDKQNNIYPIFDRMMTREDKERLLKQRSVMVWFTGLSGSGKSTVAIALEQTFLCIRSGQTWGHSRILCLLEAGNKASLGLVLQILPVFARRFVAHFRRRPH